VSVDRTLGDLLDAAEDIWGADEQMSLADMVVFLLIVLGDIGRQRRAQSEGRGVDRAEMEKEWGNLLLSLIRYIARLGLDVGACVYRAEAAQRRYVEDHRA
jgi:hypothetical protein